jgi:hypothetical protein
MSVYKAWKWLGFLRQCSFCSWEEHYLSSTVSTRFSLSLCIKQFVGLWDFEFFVFFSVEFIFDFVLFLGCFRVKLKSLVWFTIKRRILGQLNCDKISSWLRSCLDDNLFAKKFFWFNGMFDKHFLRLVLVILLQRNMSNKA